MKLVSEGGGVLDGGEVRVGVAVAVVAVDEVEVEVVVGAEALVHGGVVLYESMNRGPGVVSGLIMGLLWWCRWGGSGAVPCMEERLMGLLTTKLVGADGVVTLYRDRVDVKMKGRLRTTRVPYASITRVSLEDGEALSTRVTATRVLALGVFALAAKKRVGGTKFLTIESDEVFVTVEVPRKKVNEARKVAAMIEQRRR